MTTTAEIVAALQADPEGTARVVVLAGKDGYLDFFQLYSLNLALDVNKTPTVQVGPHINHEVYRELHPRGRKTPAPAIMLHFV